MNSVYINKWLEMPTNIKQVINSYMKARGISPEHITTLTPKGTNYKIKCNVYSIEQIEKQIPNKRRRSNALEVCHTFLKTGKLIKYELSNKHDYRSTLEAQDRSTKLVAVWRTMCPLKYRVYRRLGTNGNVLDGERKFQSYVEKEYYKVYDFIEEWVHNGNSINSLAIAIKDKAGYKDKKLTALTQILHSIRRKMPTFDIKRVKTISKIRKGIKTLERGFDE